MRFLIYAALIFFGSCSAASNPGTTPRTIPADGGAQVDKSDPRPKSNWPPDDPTSPHLRGQGWYCHDARDEMDSISLCHRSEQRCEESRADSTADYQTSTCRFQKRAACMFAMDAGTGTELAICVDTLDECRRHSMTLQSKPGVYKFVSKCEALD